MSRLAAIWKTQAAEFPAFLLALQTISMLGVDVSRFAKKSLTWRRSAGLSVFAPDSDIIARPFGDRSVPLHERPPRSAADTSVTADIYSRSSPYEMWSF